MLRKRAYIIADSHLALNAGWNTEMLAVELSDLQDADFPILNLGSDDSDLNKLMSGMDYVKEDNFYVDAELQKPSNADYKKVGD